MPPHLPCGNTDSCSAGVVSGEFQSKGWIDRSSVSAEQRKQLDAILRQGAFPATADVNEQRRQLKALLSAQPLPADVRVTAAEPGGAPTAEITVDGIEPRHTVLYFHGGVYVFGDAFLAAELASQVGRRTRARAISVDYRLAPEHPYPAAVDDALAAYEALLHTGTDPSDIVLAGESAGGGLAIATLGNARDHGLPLPAAADHPGWNARGAPRRRHPARRASRHRGCPGQSRRHPWGAARVPGLSRILEEGAAALDRAGQFLSVCLASAERVAA